MSSNNKRCLGRLKASVFPVQPSLYISLPPRIQPSGFRIDWQNREDSCASPVLKSDALGPFRVAYIKFPISVNREHKHKSSRAMCYQLFIMFVLMSMFWEGQHVQVHYEDFWKTCLCHSAQDLHISTSGPTKDSHQ